MADILVRDLNPAVLKQLKALAKQHGRSLQKEVKQILEETVPLAPQAARSLAETWQRRLRGRRFRDSAELLREDRDR